MIIAYGYFKTIKKNKSVWVHEMCTMLIDIESQCCKEIERVAKHVAKNESYKQFKVICLNKAVLDMPLLWWTR